MAVMHTNGFWATSVAVAMVVVGTASAQASETSASPDAVTAAATVERISVAVIGEPDQISSRSSRPALNAHGTVVAYDSAATNLVPNDTNALDDVFVRDRADDSTVRISVSNSGAQANGDSTWPSVSGDGHRITFHSAATNLVAGDKNHASDVFIHRGQAGKTRLVSSGLGGAPANGPSFLAAISGNGRFVAFASDATNLAVLHVPEADREVYVRDLRTGVTEVVSLKADGSAAGGGASSPAISRDGRYVAFTSLSSDIVPGDTNGEFDVFVRDRLLATTVRVNVTSSGGQAEGGASSLPAISADGRWVAFASDATNLVAADTNERQDVFVHSAAGQTERVSVSFKGAQANDQSVGPGVRGGLTFGPDISRHGRYVTFDSIATNLVRHDTGTCEIVGGPSFLEPGQCPDVFVRDQKAGRTTRVSVTRRGAQANDASTDPAISTDGKSVVFFTLASNLAGTDTNTCRPFFDAHPGQCPDVYLHQN